MSLLKIFRTLILLLLLFLAFFYFFGRTKIYPASELQYGVTFSQKQARDLGMDWEKSYLTILDELKIKKIRLSAYWNEVEQNPGQFSWNDLDWMIKEASNRNVEIILAMGARLPRWPECHYPGWTKNINDSGKEQKLLSYIRATIDRYKNEKNITAWQIENEPFLPYFGECPKLNKETLDKEIALARSLDNRHIIVTDSGELSIWVMAARRADIFGTTMYRNTYSRLLERYIHYPISPSFFIFKRNLAALFAHPKDWIVIELQAEPWGRISYQNLSAEEKARTMDVQKFREIIEFSRLAGFREFYLWGVEWWLWEKEKQNNPEMWNEAKKIFSEK